VTSPEPLFTATVSEYVKVQCLVCGRRGYPGGSWQDACRAGHPYVCGCGRRFSTKQGLMSHRSKEAKAARQAEASGMDWPPVSDVHRPTE
jgi:hypothetical protein